MAKASVTKKNTLKTVERELCEKLGDFLKNSRIKADYTQSEVAELLGYTSGQFISNIERGLHWPPLEVMVKMAKTYDVPEDKMFKMYKGLKEKSLKAQMQFYFDLESKSKRKSARR